MCGKIQIDIEHAKRFGLSQAAILSVFIELQEALNKKELVDDDEIFDGRRWFYCRTSDLDAIVPLSEKQLLKNIKALEQAGVILSRKKQSSDRRNLYTVIMEML